jgi:hypothetical protein
LHLVKPNLIDTIVDILGSMIGVPAPVRGVPACQCPCPRVPVCQ